LALLFKAAVAQHCSHRVNLRVASSRVAAVSMDFFEDRHGRGKLQTRAAVFLRNEGGLRHLFDQRLSQDMVVVRIKHSLGLPIVGLPDLK
jgi:hypothetical protein